MPCNVLGSIRRFVDESNEDREKEEEIMASVQLEARVNSSLSACQPPPWAAQFTLRFQVTQPMNKPSCT